jgi:arginine deiminase
MAGLTARELATETNVQLQTTTRERDFFLVRPLPHCYCTRDPGAVIGRRVVCANMHFDVRIPEPLLLRMILTSHPILRGAELGFGADRSSQRPFTIEGGDIVVLSGEAVAVGCSERTRSASIHLLAERLFESDGIARVYEIHVPARRAHVHLDTVLTVVDRGRVVASAAALDRVTDIVLYEPYRIANHTAAVPLAERRSLREILAAELGGGSLDVCDIDGGSRTAANEEQPPDATGVLAIGPSRVIAYDRNVHANRALRERGIDVIEVEGTELGRDHRGPRCIALPLRRSAAS